MNAQISFWIKITDEANGYTAGDFAESFADTVGGSPDLKINLDRMPISMQEWAELSEIAQAYMPICKNLALQINHTWESAQ